MHLVVRLAAFVLPGLLIAAAHFPAHAAAAKATFFACKEQTVFKKPFQHPAGQASKDVKEDKAKTEAYFKAKIASGECIQLARGEQVSIDQRDGELSCVRQTGGLNCYWTADNVIELYPSAQPTSDQPHRAKSH
jgi:hypothetical protein